MLFERSLAGPIHVDCGWGGGEQISYRPISSLLWLYGGNNELLHSCFDPSPDLNPPPTNLHSQMVCIEFTYTYDLKESFRSWISPCPPHFETYIGPFRTSDAPRWASFWLKWFRSLLSVSRKSLSHSFVTSCLFICFDVKALLVHT